MPQGRSIDANPLSDTPAVRSVAEQAGIRSPDAEGGDLASGRT
jgi:hypothetical protein